MGGPLCPIYFALSCLQVFYEGHMFCISKTSRTVYTLSTCLAVSLDTRIPQGHGWGERFS